MATRGNGLDPAGPYADAAEDVAELAEASAELAERLAGALAPEARPRPNRQTRRNRDYRREYLSRQARRPEGQAARQAAGHRPPPVDMAMSALVEPGSFVLFDQLTRSEARRVARYDSLLSQLDKGQLSAEAFHRRVRMWRPIRGERFLSNPEAALALLDERRVAGDEVFIYEGRQQ